MPIFNRVTLSYLYVKGHHTRVKQAPESADLLLYLIKVAFGILGSLDLMVFLLGIYTHIIDIVTEEFTTQ